MLIANKVTEKDVRDYLTEHGYVGKTARFEELELVAIQRPGWLQIFQFRVQVKNPQREWVTLHGVVRDDERNGTEICTFETPDAQLEQIRTWSNGLIRRRDRSEKTDLDRLFLVVSIIAVAAIVLCAIPSFAADNQLTPEEKSEGWKLLFNGKSHEGWKCNNGKPIAAPIEEGCLVPYKSGGYIIIHEKIYDDFVFACDVRWEDPRCNSGIFFRVEEPKNPVHTGFEIQVMAGEKTGKHQFGAIYDLVSTTKNPTKGTGEWNHVEIRCDGPEIQVKVNGEIVSQMNADDFDKPGVCPDGQKHKYKLNGKPRAVKDFARKGYVGFQDHGHKVWYKNIKLKELN